MTRGQSTSSLFFRQEHSQVLSISRASQAGWTPLHVKCPVCVRVTEQREVCGARRELEASLALPTMATSHATVLELRH